MRNSASCRRQIQCKWNKNTETNMFQDSKGVAITRPKRTLKNSRGKGQRANPGRPCVCTYLCLCVWSRTGKAKAKFSDYKEACGGDSGEASPIRTPCLPLQTECSESKARSTSISSFKSHKAQRIQKVLDECTWMTIIGNVEARDRGRQSGRHPTNSAALIWGACQRVF